MQMASEIHRPLEGPQPLGQVAVFSVVSAEKCRPWHAKRAAELRKTLEQQLEKNGGVLVVHSQELPPHYGTQRQADRATVLGQAWAGIGGKTVDTICLVELRDAAGELALGLSLPPERMVSVRGRCDYELRLLDVSTGQERFCATGSWSEQTELPMFPRMPSPSHFGEQLAQTLSPADAPSTSGAIRK
jgi:hypothetical protein